MIANVDVSLAQFLVGIACVCRINTPIAAIDLSAHRRQVVGTGDGKPFPELQRRTETCILMPGDNALDAGRWRADATGLIETTWCPRQPVGRRTAKTTLDVND